MSSTYNDIRAAIEGRIATEMAMAPAYPVSYQNVPFVPPNNAPWVQVFIRFGDNAYATLIGPNTGYNRQNGALTINVFTPAGVGTGANLVIAERIKDLFDRQIVSQIIFDAASGPVHISPGITEAGVSASGTLASSFLQTQLTITFEAYLE